MIIELVSDGSPECPLVRIYGYDNAQLGAIRAAVAGLSAIEDRGAPVLLEVEELGMSDFCIGLGHDNGAILNEGSVKWIGDRDYWLEITALIDEMKPISQSRNRYQWLSGPMAYYESQGISVLLTELEGGRW